MPISSGANRWPKSYWTKPEPRQIQTRLVKVTERPSVRRSTPRTMSLSSSVYSQPKLDNGLESEPSPASDTELQRPAVRSTGVAAPRSVENLMTNRQGNDGERRGPQPQHPRHVESCSATNVAGTSSATTSSVSLLKRIGCTRSVSSALLIICFVYLIWRRIPALFYSPVNSTGAPKPIL